MEVWRSKIHSINESVCPGAGHLSSFFCPGAGHCHAFPARPPGIVNLKKKKVQMPGGCPGGGGGRAMLELTDALRTRSSFSCESLKDLRLNEFLLVA